VAGDDLELAPILEQFRQPLLEERQRRVAERGGNVLLDLAAGVPLLAAVDVEHPLGEREVGRVVRRGVGGNDPVTGIANADERAGQHPYLTGLSGRRGLDSGRDPSTPSQNHVTRPESRP
jgi:hypothetical protein